MFLGIDSDGCNDDSIFGNDHGSSDSVGSNFDDNGDTNTDEDEGDNSGDKECAPKRARPSNTILKSPASEFEVPTAILQDPVAPARGDVAGESLDAETLALSDVLSGHLDDGLGSQWNMYETEDTSWPVQNIEGSDSEQAAGSLTPNGHDVHSLTGTSFRSLEGPSSYTLSNVDHWHQASFSMPKQQ